MLNNRKYKSGSRWALWRWTETPSGYITRLHIFMCPWFAIVVHWLHKPDAEPHRHDHPVSFLSLILRGGYTEFRKRGLSSSLHYENHYWYNWIRASTWDNHRIDYVEPNTVTLCFMGPKRRDWGFHTPDGWVCWKNYNAEKYGSNNEKSE